MGRWIRAWGIAVLLIITLGWYLSIDWIIKNSIETFGTQANGARVELSTAKLTLWPTRLELTGLKVTDAGKPMSNLVEAGNISTELDGLMLLRRQLIIESAALSDLQFNTPRQTSGAIAAAKNATADDSVFDIDLGGAIPTTSLPDINSLLKNEEQYFKDQIDQTQQRLTAIEQRWQSNIQQLPDEDKADEYKARFKKLKSGNFLEKVTGLTRLKEDVNKDIDLITSLKQQLEQDRKAVDQEINNAKAMPDREANRLMKKVGFSDQDVSFMSALTGNQVSQWLQQGLGIFKKITQAMGSGQTEAKPPRGEGRWIRFEEQNPLPQVLLKQATLDGIAGIADDSISFEGKAADFAFPPSDWTTPATLALTGQNSQQASLRLNASFDHRQELFNDQLSLQIDQLSLNNVTLSDSKDMGLTLGQAKTDITGAAQLGPNTIALDFTGTFSQAKLLVDSPQSTTTQQVIADSLGSVDNFDLQLIAKGDINSPTIKLRSNLDKALTAGLKKQISAQSGELKQKLKQQIQKNLSGDLSALSDKADYLDQIEDLLNSRKDEIKQLKIL
ncbi:TIGR03545 family protein [Oceanicoccus sagamiensis]|uniref:TIGR03545 family protein n=1 Tax=Oceanicoccus sagamiensis TaxID=716816 RepID=A0A1X9NHX0_9GAMM|nr:TIGR03545 family protein [Oceanicoccus sagamiensis]ARN75109.1 hypothetical protein BST96_13885 [Oceanicoccus sagamiensis]